MRQALHEEVPERPQECWAFLCIWETQNAASRCDASAKPQASESVGLLRSSDSRELYRFTEVRIHRQGSEAPFAEFGFAVLAEAPQTLAQVGPEAASGSHKPSSQCHEVGTQAVVSSGSCDNAYAPVLHEAT